MSDLRKKSIRRGYKNLFLRMVCLAAILYLLFTQMFLITQNHGQQMFPSLKDGDLCIAFRSQMQRLMRKEYVRGDIVIYHMDGKRYFGRVIACGNDVVNIDGTGALMVNGTVQGGEILFPTLAHDDTVYPYTVPENQFYVMGDYRTSAVDSRDLGPIPSENIEGKLITILRRRGL